MEKNTKIVFGTIIILLICFVMFNTSLTGALSWAFWRQPSRDVTCPEVKPIGEPYCAPNQRQVMQKYLSYRKVHSGATSYKCEPMPIEKVIQTCKEGCRDGGCIKREVNCFDSDGLNLGVKGYCETPSRDKVWDHCSASGENIIDEAFCDADDRIGIKTYTCPNTFMCNDGACMIGRKCMDSDGGLNYEERGKVNGLEAPGIWDTWYDYCGVAGEESGKLVEYYCKPDNYGAKDLHLCPNGCLNGECKPASGNYLTVTTEFKPNVNTARSLHERGLSKAKTIYIYTPKSETLEILPGILSFENITLPHKTNEVWLQKTTGYDYLIDVYAKDEGYNPAMRWIGYIDTTIPVIRDLIKVQNGDKIAVGLAPGYSSPFDIQIVYKYTFIEGDMISSRFRVVNGEVASLGLILSLAESNELSLFDSIKGGEDIGTNTKDITVKDGTIIRDPKSNGDSDQVVLDVPI